MIVFELACRAGHRFEAWFASSAAYVDQRESGLVSCPHCGETMVDKAPMAPAVAAKGNARAGEQRAGVANAVPPDVADALKALARAQSRALEKSTWVGDRFAETSRAMHYGEREHAIIHGHATRDEARALSEEGIPVSPLPFPVAPPDEIN